MSTESENRVKRLVRDFYVDNLSEFLNLAGELCEVVHCPLYALEGTCEGCPLLCPENLLGVLRSWLANSPEYATAKTVACAKCGSAICDSCIEEASCTLPIPAMEINREVVFSTGHMMKEDGDILADCSRAYPAVHASEYGWRVFTDLDDEESEDVLACALQTAGLSQEFIRLWRTARGYGCKWLVLDCDGPYAEGFPQFDWEAMDQ